MVKQFKNRVRIADVQKEFDTLCSRIDNLNQKIQDVTEIGEDFDYSEGSSQLAAAGYTLTVGGLKKALEACDGTVLGARAFRVNDSHVKMSGGYLITRDGGYRLPDSYLTIPQKFRTLYFNPETRQYQWTARGTEIVIVEEGKSLINQDCLEPTSMGDDYLQYRYVQSASDGHYNYISASNLYNGAGQVGDHIDLLFYKTRDLIPLGLEDSTYALTYDPSSPNKVRLNIADYVYLATNKISINDKINIQFKDGTLDINNIILGTLSDDGSYFTPKFDINFHTYAGGGLSQYFITDVCGMTNTPTVTSVDSTIDYPVGGKCASIRLDRLGGAGVHYNNDDNYATLKNIQYSFTQDEILPDNKYFRITVTNSNDVVYTSNIQLPDNIENYNINCVIFKQLNAGANQSFDIGGNLYIRKDLNKIIKADSSEILLKQNYTYTEWVEREVEGDDVAYKICDINMNRGSIYANDHFGVQNENIYGTYEISIPNRTFGVRSDSSASAWFTNWLDWANLSLNMGKAYEALPSTHDEKFVVPLEGRETDDGVRYEAYFGSQRISCNKGLARALKCSIHMNYLFVPKNIANPFSYRLTRVGWNTQSSGTELTTDPTKCSNQKVFNVKISKKLKQKTL